MADLAITVDMSSVTQAEKKVNSFQNQLNRLIKKQREGAISDEAFAKGKLEIKRAYQEVGVSSQKASGQVEKYVRQMNEAKKAQDRSADMQKWFTNQRRKMRMMEESARLEQQQIRSQERLREKYVPLYAASKRYERALEEINQAHREGVFSTQQYNNAIEQLNVDFSKTREVGVGNTRSANDFGVAMQQSGYQIGDFLVQVQSGTNAFVAFGQQATQLVGILPMFSNRIKFISKTALTGLSAGLGIVIPLVTALAGAFMRTRQEAKDATPPIEALTSAVDKFSSAAERASKGSDDLAEKYGDSADKARELFDVNKTLAELDAIDALKKSLVSLRDEFGNFSDVSVNSLEGAMETFDELGDRAITGVGLTDKQFRSANNAVQIYRETVVDLENRLGSTRQEAFQFATELSKLSQADGPKAAAEQLEIVRNLYFDIIGGTEGATKAQRDLLREMVNTAIETLNLRVDMEDVKDTTSGAAGEAGSLVDNYEKALDTLSDFGSKVADDLKEFEDRAKEAAKYLKDAGFNAKEIANVDLEDGIEAAADAALLLATRLGVSLRSAEDILELSGKTTPQIRDELGQLPGTPGGGIPGAATSSRDLSIFNRDVPETLLGDGSEAGSDGGGGGSGETLQERINKAREAVDKLRASYDEQYAVELKVAEAREKVNKLTELQPELTDEANRVLQQYIQSLRETDSVMGDFANNAAKQMSDAFMSIVDGSKSASDAFQNMAQAIIRQAFEMAVINPIMNSIFGGVSGFNPLPAFFADGAAFNKGKVTPFADGGVVNQPTVFPMANGAGLMGEAGPEAVMPLKRGKDGKLGVQAQGSQGNVTVENHFHIAANGDDSVKRIITQEAPKIANLTKRQILDERSRGGAFKKTFG